MKRFRDKLYYVNIIRMMQPNAKPRLTLHLTPALILCAMLFAFPFKAFAQNSGTLSGGFRFAEDNGEDLFANVCRGCHMSDARGAAGAGAYPSLAGNENLQARLYAISIVVNGQRGMPAFGAMMSDDQIAAVVNYLRTHFNNAYPDALTAADVKAMRR